MKAIGITEAAAIVNAPPLSQSRFELLACPHLYVERVVKGIRESENEYSLRGTEIHKACADYVDYLVQKRQTSDQEWFAENILRRPYLPDAIEILSRMIDKFSIDPEKVLDTELWLPLDEDFNALDSNPGDAIVAYEGTLDLVLLLDPHTAEIEDYKSFWQIQDADTFQSRLYPLLLFKHFEQLETVTFRLRFVRYGVTREVKFTRGDIPKLEKEVREARKRQVALHFAATEAGVGPANDEAMPGQHCAYCPKLRNCPLGETNAMTEEPTEVVRRALWAQQLLKHDMATLKAHVNVNGPIQITDANDNPYTATFRLQQKPSYPAVPVLALVAANDPELAKKLTVSGLSTALKTKKRAGLAGLINEHRIERAQTRFSIAGVAEDEDEGE
jgi:hypothetical protein